MAAETNISSNGGEPQVTVTGGNLIRYRCRCYLWKPEGQTWPGTNSRKKKIHDVTLNKDHPPTDTFSLGDPEALRTLFLSWVIDMKVPGGGGPLQLSRFGRRRGSSSLGTQLRFSDWFNWIILSVSSHL